MNTLNARKLRTLAVGLVAVATMCLTTGARAADDIIWVEAESGTGQIVVEPPTERP